LKPLELALAFVFGVAFGSFANVVVFRVPRGFSVVSPGSLCPGCEQPIAWYDNIPLASFFILRAKCRNCGVHISVRYPIVEILTGLVWAAMVWRIGIHPELPAYLAFATALVILSAIDVEHHRLPNKVLGPAAIVGAVLFLGAAAIGGRWANLEHAALGALFYGLPMLFIGLAAPSAMGGGDVKFAPYLGFHLGWLGLRLVLAGGLLGLVAGGLGGAAALLVGGKGMKDPIPFGPFMALGALAAILLGHSILSVYVGG
jgi:leader peptidase (prepilin peptidase)/N-methyltransferase